MVVQEDFDAPFGQNAKQILYRIRCGAPGNSLRPLLGKTQRKSYTKIQREAPDLFECPFLAKYKGILYKLQREAPENVFDTPFGQTTKDILYKNPARSAGDF